MARGIHRLTALAVTRAKAAGLYCDGGGLFLRIGPTGAKSWTFRYKVGGKTREAGLGPVHTVSLAEAREAALQARKQRLAGIDPLAEKRAGQAAERAAAAKAITFRDAAEQYIAAHRAGWAPRHADMWAGSLRDHAFPALGGLDVAAIETAHIMRALEPIWTTKTETASRVRSRIELVLGWATTRGYRLGENPARWRGHLANLLPKPSKVRAPIKGHDALPYNGIGDFMVKLRGQAGLRERALEFAILTAARTSEVLGTPWSEIDLAAALWAIPAERMKGSREHRVPLSAAAVALLEALPRSGPYVFANEAGGKLDVRTMDRAVKKLQSGVTVHGFRSTFSTWAAERTRYSYEARELSLAHQVGNRVERAYQRGELLAERRRLMDEWASFCASPAADGENVVAIRA